jgi:hypothetical protein
LNFELSVVLGIGLLARFGLKVKVSRSKDCKIFDAVAESPVNAVAAGTPYRFGLHRTQANIEISRLRQLIRLELGCSGGPTLVSMMKPANLRNRYDLAQHRGLDRSGLSFSSAKCVRLR